MVWKMHKSNGVLGQQRKARAIIHSSSNIHRDENKLYRDENKLYFLCMLMILTLLKILCNIAGQNPLILTNTLSRRSWSMAATYIPSKHQQVDELTKSLPTNHFNQLICKLRMIASLRGIIVNM